MSSDSLHHLTAQRANDFALDRLSEAEHAAVAEHLKSCEACRRMVAGDRPTIPTMQNSWSDSNFEGVREFHAALDEIPEGLRSSKKYRILGKLGQGGMGVVYQAEQLTLGRVVALKVMRPHLVPDAKAVNRFREEAKSVAALQHPNIVVTHDADQEGNAHFIVMGYVEGVDLASLVKKKGPLPVAQACGLIRQAARGLRHAHEMGMVHRDIKPHNLMVSKKGRVTILDFGLARLAHELRSGASSAGNVTGTPDYMSPEQARDPTSVDGRADVYSLGCTLFFLLTGRPPFVGSSWMDVLLAHAVELPPPLVVLRPDVPPDLAALVERMLAKNPADRPSTPAEVSAGLRPFMNRLNRYDESSTTPMVEVQEPPAEDEGGWPAWAMALAAGCALAVALLAAALTFHLMTKPKDAGGPDAGLRTVPPAEEPIEKPAEGNKSKEAETPEKKPDDKNFEIKPFEVKRTEEQLRMPQIELPSHFVNWAGGKMAHLKGGTFLMGSPESEADRRPEEKQHRVTVSPFYLGETEVTQGQFRKVMGYNPSHFGRATKEKEGEKYEWPPGGGAAKVAGDDDTDKCPVENVSWHEAKAFCDRLNELDKDRPAGWVYRLPREAEWEYACRAGTPTAFHFRDVLDDSETQANFDGTQPYGSDNKSRWLERTCQVGSYKPNAFGLYDMHGNAFEWCEDRFGKDYYAETVGATDPAGPGAGRRRVFRGGDWGGAGRDCRSAARFDGDPAKRTYNLGFRVALVPEARE